MQTELTHVMQMTLQNPRAAARHLMDRQLPLSTVWLVMALMAVVLMWIRSNLELDLSVLQIPNSKSKATGVFK